MQRRLIGFTGLIGWLGLLVGCGGESKPAPGEPKVEVGDPAPAPGPDQPGATDPKDPYQLDPAKHVIPTTAVAGRLGGKPFTPDRIEVQGNQITFRQGKDFFADLNIDIILNDTRNPAEGLKLVVRPDQKWPDDVPTLHVSVRKGKDALPDTRFVNEGYALTLELSKSEKGKSAGKILLCLPGAERSYLAGTFTAERKRALSEPPGAMEVPFIRGSVSPPAKKGQMVWVGYVGIPNEGKIISDGAGSQADGDGGHVRSLTFAPRCASLWFEKFVPRFDFTNLPPGRYLVHARVKDGPTTWSWVTVPADGMVTADLKLDAKNVGTVEVQVPPGQREVRLVPTDLGTPPPSEEFLNTLLFWLELKADVKDGKATITNVPPGKYQLRASDLRADVEVTAGKTTMAELKPAKK
jgi:hypothetical protein